MMMRIKLGTVTTGPNLILMVMVFLVIISFNIFSCWISPPKVTSSIVRLVPRPAPLPCDRALLERVTQAAFGQRRKMLRQSLRSLGMDASALLEAADLPPTARAEDIPVAGFVALAQALAAASR